MNLARNTPLLVGESLMSWVSRIARDETGMATFDFLNFIELNRKDILEAAPRGLDRLAELTSVPHAELETGAYLRIGERFYVHRGHRFHAEFAGGERTTFCPSCLLEDCRSGGPSRGRRVGRVNWLFSPIRTCAIHRLPLYRADHRSYDARFQDMEVVAPHVGRLSELVRNSRPRAVSPLQSYVEGRLDGTKGPSWLDGQQVDLAARSTEMLGACLLFSSHIDLPDLTEDQWDAAGATGYEFTARGDDGVREALTKISIRARGEGCKGGPQAVLGRLFQWLQFQRGNKPMGPIREVVREFILDSMPLEPGTVLFGETVTARRRHSVASLSKQTGLNRRTLNRALVMTCLMPDGHPDRMDPLLTVDAIAGERLADRMLASIPVTGIPAYLNCHRRQAEMIVQHGVVQRIGDGTPTQPRS